QFPYRYRILRHSPTHLFLYKNSQNREAFRNFPCPPGSSPRPAWHHWRIVHHGFLPEPLYSYPWHKWPIGLGHLPNWPPIPQGHYYRIGLPVWHGSPWPQRHLPIYNDSLPLPFFYWHRG